MAHEIRFATLATDARYAALIGAAFFMMFEDPGAFPKSEIWHYAGSVEGSMSDTIQTTIYGHGGDPMTDTPEGTAATGEARLRATCGRCEPQTRCPRLPR